MAPGFPQDAVLGPGGGLPQGAELPQSGGLPQGGGLPQRGGTPQGTGSPGDTGLPQRRSQQRAGAGSRDQGGLMPPGPLATDPGSAAQADDSRSWFNTQNPSAPPREREPGIDRDYRLDRDRSLARDTAPEDYSSPRVPMPEPPPAQSPGFGDDPLSGPLEARDFRGTGDLPRRAQRERPGQPEFQADTPSAFQTEAPTARPRRFDAGQRLEAPQAFEPAQDFERAQPFEAREAFEPAQPFEPAQAFEPARAFDAPQRWDDPSPTQFDQIRLPQEAEYRSESYPAGDQISPVYQTGMQLVVPPGGEWTFRDPGTGAIPRYGSQPDEYVQPGRPSFTGQGGGQGGADPFAPGGLPAGPMAPPAERKRGRKAPVVIGVLAVVVLIGIGAAVEAPKYLHHSDPGCTAYSSDALPAYNRAIGDLNSQASQATLNGDLSTAVTQLTTAVNQAQSASVKTALQGLLTDLTKVQSDVHKGSVAASTVSTLNAASAAADNACQGS